MHYWLTLSHSVRLLDLSRSSPDELFRRFNSRDRLEGLPPLASLDSSLAPSWANNISVWYWNPSTGLKLVRLIERNYTVNHAAVLGNGRGLAVCAHDRLEFCDTEGEVHSEFTHPWFGGGHTVYEHRGDYIVSCSASDSVLRIGGAELVVRDIWRIPPELYGSNYALTLRDDVRRNYIPTDLQISHVNCAYPTARSTLVTCFIQGSVVDVRQSGSFDVLASGFVGCHGARRARDGHVYFCDTPRGRIVHIDPTTGRFAFTELSSTWLHDAVELTIGVYACAVGDRNSLEVIDRRDGTVLEAYALADLGATPCLLWSGMHE